MQQKISNILFVFCGACIVLPQLMRFFNNDADSLLALVPLGWIILFSGILAMLNQFFILLKNKTKLTLSSIVFILAFLFLIIGFSFKELGFTYANILLIGALLFGLWFALPTKNKKDVV